MRRDAGQERVRRGGGRGLVTIGRIERFRYLSLKEE